MTANGNTLITSADTTIPESLRQ